MEFLEVVFLMFAMLLLTLVFVFLIRHSNQVLLQRIYDLEDRQKKINKMVKHFSKNSSSSGVSLVKKVEALEKRLAEQASSTAATLKASKSVEAKV